MLPALYIGRFQPFHLGHLDALRQILRKEKNILIGIGSALNFRTQENPFTSGERFLMIYNTLRNEKIGVGGKKILSKVVGIIPIPDINNFSKWVSHVEQLCPPFGTVYTGSPIVKKLFMRDGKHPVADLIIRKKITATQIRKLLREEKSVKKIVPSSVADLMIQWKTASLLQKIKLWK